MCVNLHWKSFRGETGLPEKSAAESGSQGAGRDGPAKTKSWPSRVRSWTEEAGSRERRRTFPRSVAIAPLLVHEGRSQEALCLFNAAKGQVVHQGIPTGSKKAAIVPAMQENSRLPVGSAIHCYKPDHQFNLLNPTELLFFLSFIPLHPYTHTHTHRVQERPLLGMWEKAVGYRRN